MFEDAYNFNVDISSWDVRNVKDFTRMFTNARSFNRDLAEWNLLSVVRFEQMFTNSTSFSYDLCSWGHQLAQNLESENVSESTGVNTMFKGTQCPKSSIATDYSISPPGPFCHTCS
jgi:surface protein